MRFAHLADCHIGSWRDPKLRDVSTNVFVKTVDSCIQKEIDFLLIAGDLFHTSLPGIDLLKQVVTALKKLEQLNIPVYIIPGSHDFSPSGKTMLSVLEEAGLLINVVKKDDIVDGKLKLKFTQDKKTGAKITGLLGKKGMLDKVYYENLLHENLEQEQGFKIFMFHTALSEFKPQEMVNMESQPLSLLPKYFNYYAGGHVHYILDKDVGGYGKITYPGALFPANFAELEKYGNGGYYLCDFYSEDIKLEWVPVLMFNTFNIKVDCDHKTPEQVTKELLSFTESREFNNTIVTVRVNGILESGKVSDIDFKQLFNVLYEKSAYFVMKNTSGINTKEFEEIKIDFDDVAQIEQKVIDEHLGQVKLDQVDVVSEKELVGKLMNFLSRERDEGEKVDEFEFRVKQEVESLW